MGFLANAKDRLIEKTVPAFLNGRYLEPYGSITGFSIDTAAKSIDVELQLKGEVEKVRLTVPEFDLVEKDEETFIKINKITTSREWLTRVAQDFLVNRLIRIPREAARALKAVL